MKKNFTVQAIDNIREIARPLGKLGFHDFHHDITFGKGKLAMLTTQEKMYSIYYQQALPMICTDDSGRTLTEGIYLSNFLMEKHKDCALLLPKLNQQLGCKNFIAIVERQNDCQHLYTFLSSVSDMEFLHLAVNQLDNLKQFIQSYKHAAKAIIDKAKQPKNQLTLSNASELMTTEAVQFQRIDNAISAKLDAHRFMLTHKLTGKTITLTPKLYLVFQLLSQGHTAKESARIMQVSYRTIEHHVEKLRQLAQAKNAKELIANYVIA